MRYRGRCGGDWTGIPIGEWSKDEIDSMSIADQLKKRVGQDHAMDAIASGFNDRRPNWTIPTSRWAFSCFAAPAWQDRNRDALSEAAYSGDEA